MKNEKFAYRVSTISNGIYYINKLIRMSCKENTQTELREWKNLQMIL